MVDFTKEFYDSDPRTTTANWTSSYDSCITDEGYHTDDKPPLYNEEEFEQQDDYNQENEIPILKSKRTM